MNNRIEITKGNDKINFHLVCDTGKHYLFTQKFSKGVYEYFRYGKSEREIMNFRRWKDNPRLSKTIEKMPMYLHYVKKYVS